MLPIPEESPYSEEIYDPVGIKGSKCCAEEVEALGGTMIEDGYPGDMVE